MKKLLPTFILFLVPFILLAAEDTTYLNNALKKVKASEAVYKRIIQQPLTSPSYLVTDFDRSNNIYMKAESNVPNGKIFHGKCTYFYTNGLKRCEGDYNNNMQHGIWRYWSSDHKDTVTVEFDYNGKQTTLRNTIAARLDSLQKKKSQSQAPVQSDPSSGERKTSAEVDARYPGGPKAFNQFIVRNIKYPKEAELRGIGGRTIIYFEIDKEGNVCNTMPLTMIGFGLEEEAIRVLTAMPQWTPAMQDGKFVRVRRTVPILFKLPN